MKPCGGGPIGRSPGGPPIPESTKAKGEYMKNKRKQKVNEELKERFSRKNNRLLGSLDGVPISHNENFQHKALLSILLEMDPFQCW